MSYRLKSSGWGRVFNNGHKSGDFDTRCSSHELRQGTCGKARVPCLTLCSFELNPTLLWWGLVLSTSVGQPIAAVGSFEDKRVLWQERTGGLWGRRGFSHRRRGRVKALDDTSMDMRVGG